MKPHARSRRERIRRAAKWAGLVLCVLIGAAWGASRWWTLCYCWSVSPNRVGGVAINGGAFCGGVDHVVRMPPPGWGGWRNTHRSTVWAPLLIYQQYGPVLYAPLWIPFLAVAAPTVWLWWRDRRRAEPGRCAACGYDLAGLASGAVCPECGKSESAVRGDSARTPPSGGDSVRPHARSRRGQLRPAAKWAGVVLCVVTAGLWVFSVIWLLYYFDMADGRPMLWCEVAMGCVGVHVLDPEIAGVAGSTGRQWHFHRSPIVQWTPGFVYQTNPFSLSLRVPLWIPVLLFTPPTVWLWRRDRCAKQPGVCAECGYDLAGLASGATCPECGKSEQVMA